MAEQPKPPSATAANPAAATAPKSGKPPADKAKKPAGARPDFATLAGILLAFGGILGGLIHGRRKDQGRLPDHGGHDRPGRNLRRGDGEHAAQRTEGGRQCGWCMCSSTRPSRRTRPSKRSIGYATKARKNGLVSLETEALEIQDPFLRKALTLAVDGTDLQELRNMMQLDIDMSERTRNRGIQGVRKRGRLFAHHRDHRRGDGPHSGDEEPRQHRRSGARNRGGVRGHGVRRGLANIFLLPAATKIKSRIERDTELKELKLEGVVAIVEGLNPKLIRSKLDAYRQHEEKPAKTQGERRREGRSPAAKPAPAAKPVPAKT